LIAAAATLAAILIGATVPPIYVGYGNLNFFLKPDNLSDRTGDLNYLKRPGTIMVMNC